MLLQLIVSINIDMTIEELRRKQPKRMEQFERVVQKGQLAHAYLFEGPVGAGIPTFAYWLSMLTLYGTRLDQEEVKNQWHRITAADHPDVLFIEPDGQTIKVEQIRLLKSELSKSGMESAKKVLIIDQAEKMTVSAANSLLKFIEEPNGQTYIFLLTENSEKILPTIRSRCQLIPFHAPSRKVIQNELVERGVSQEMSNVLSECFNSAQTAFEFYEQEWFVEFYQACGKWFRYLISKDNLAFVFVQQNIVGLCKEKEQQRLLFDLLLSFFRVESQKKLNQSANETEIFLLTQQMQQILQSQQKLASNVSFQNVCEQLAWRVIQK